MNYVVRIILAIVGFVVGVIVATLFVTVATFMKLTTLTESMSVAALITNYFLGTIIVAGLGFLPAIALILFTEIAGIRSLYVHVGICGALGLLASLGAGSFFDGHEIVGSFFPTIWTAAGFIGGFFYWLIAGRNAGIVRDEPPLLPPAGWQKPS